MSVWAYCRSCGASLAPPELGDAILGLQPCPKCEHERPLDNWERRSTIDAFMEVFNALKASQMVPPPAGPTQGG